LSYNLDSDDPAMQELESIISSYVNDFSPDDEIGWEEYTLKSLNYSLNRKRDMYCAQLGRNEVLLFIGTQYAGYE
jgi:hypothetical protein